MKEIFLLALVLSSILIVLCLIVFMLEKFVASRRTVIDDGEVDEVVTAIMAGISMFNEELPRSGRTGRRIIYPLKKEKVSPWRIQGRGSRMEEGRRG